MNRPFAVRFRAPTALPAAGARAWQRRSSPLARYALLAYGLVVLDASLFPFSGWRDLGLSAYGYLSAGWPPRALPFDLVVNGFGYLPLGFVGVLALHPRIRGAAAAVVVTLCSAVLSIHLEALQTYLPSRVASKVDVIANVLGAAVGAALAARYAHALLDTGRLRAWRIRWFRTDASRGLVLVVVWFGALVYPDEFVFGTGGLLKIFDPDGADWIARAIGLGDPGDAIATAAHFRSAEAAVAGLTLVGTGLLFLSLLRPTLRWWRRIAFLGLFVAATTAFGALARVLILDGEFGWPPLTPGARTGLATAAIALVVASVVPAAARWLPASLALLAALVVVNVYPDNPYGNAVNLAWTRGRLLNFYGLASGLNLVWPYLAIGYLLRHRGSGPRRERPPPKPLAGGAPL